MCPGIDDAGAQEDSVLRQQVGYLSRQGDDDVGNNVGQHQRVALLSNLSGQSGITEYVSGPNRVAILANAVEGGVFIGHIHCLGVDVHRQGVAGSQYQGGDGQDAAAAAQIQHGVPGFGVGLNPLQTQLGGGVRAGTEGETGIEVEGHPAVGHGIVLFPLGHHIQPLPDGERLVVLLPAVGPVVVIERSHRILTVQSMGVLGQLSTAVSVVGDVELDPGDSLHAVQQLLVHIVPVLPVLLQKLLELRLVLNDQSGHTGGGELSRHLVQPIGGGVDGDLQPLCICHVFLPFRQGRRPWTPPAFSKKRGKNFCA